MFLKYRAPFQQKDLEKTHEALMLLLVCTGAAIIIAFLQQAAVSIIHGLDGVSSMHVLYGNV